MNLGYGVVLSLLAATLAPFSVLATLILAPTPLFWSRHGSPHGTLPWLMLGWMLWLPATLAWSLAPGLSLPQAAMLLCLPLGWLAGRELHRRGQLARLLDFGLPALLLILVLWGLLQGPDTFTQKPQGPFNDPNTYAALLNLLALPLLARYLAADLAALAPWQRTAQLAILAATALVAFLTASRGGSLALLLVLPTLLWLARSRPGFLRKLLLLGSVVACAYLAAYLVSGSANVGQRLADTVSGGDPSRLMMMRSAWLMIQDHPWLGTGLGTFRLLYPQYRYAAEYATAGGWVHNDYLQLWLEAGLPMLLLILGLVAWVAWSGWRALRDAGEEALPRLGYLAAIAAILLHALVNFLFFFALVSLLVGLYLARLSAIEDGVTDQSSEQGRGNATPDSAKSADASRAIRLAAGGYALILAWLLLGQMAVEGLLGQARPIQQALLKWQVAYPRYQVAYWVSILAPFHPSPQQIMGLELADGFVLTGGGGLLREEALTRMEAAWQRAPCYLPFANDALGLIQHGGTAEPALWARGEAMVARSLACDARHGLSYYHAGRLALPRSETEARAWWYAGLAASPRLGERLLLATAILSQTTPGHERELATLAVRMAESIRALESNPGSYADQAFWGEVQHKLYRLAGKRYLELVPPPQ